MTTRGIGYFNAFLMVILILVWGSSFVVVKIALREGVTPIALATFRFLIAGGLFVAVLLVKGSRKGDYTFVEKRDVPPLVLLALSGVTFFFAAQYTGIQMAGAAIAAIFVCLLSPILITVLSSRVFEEHLNTKQIFGVGIAAAGTLIVITGGAFGFESNNEYFIGSLILLLTPILWTAYSLLGKRAMVKYSPFVVVAYVNVLGGLFLVPLSLAENSFHQIFSMRLHGWFAVLFLSVSCSLLGYYIWFYVLEQEGAAMTSSFLFAEPLVTVLFATTLVGEQITSSVVAGGLLTFVGVYLVTRK